MNSGRKTSWPNIKGLPEISNGTASQSGANQGFTDAVALSVSGGVLFFLGACAGLWLLRRGFRNQREVHPTITDAIDPTRQRRRGTRYKAGDIIGQSPLRWDGFGWQSPRPRKPVQVPSDMAAQTLGMGQEQESVPAAPVDPAETRHMVVVREGIGTPVEAEDDVVTLDDLPANPPAPGLVHMSSSSILALADVRLIDDPYGGVWAVDRESLTPNKETTLDANTPIQRSDGLRQRLSPPSRGSKPAVWPPRDDGGPATPIVENDLRGVEEVDGT